MYLLDFQEEQDTLLDGFKRVPSVTHLYMSDGEEESILPRLTSLKLDTGRVNPFRGEEAASAYEALVASRSCATVVDGNELARLEHYEFSDL